MTLKKNKPLIIPPATGYTCREASLDDTFRFVLGVESEDWVIDHSEMGTYAGVKVVHVHMRFTGTVCPCPECQGPQTIHDHKERQWRHENLGETVCYVHANVPRTKCGKCGKVSQIRVPWADPKVSYTRRFEEIAIQKMSQMSLSAVSRELRVNWRVLDHMVERKTREYLDNMDLSWVRRIRIDETSAKKNHRYITLVTEVDMGRIIFICKGKNREVVKEFARWLRDHGGDPDNITLIASDFGDSFVSGAKEYLPNAEPIFDPFHLIQLANKKLDGDRASTQFNGERLKSIRYALLKKPEDLRDDEERALMDITRDNEKVAASYAMKESLRQMYSLPAELAREHLRQWVEWVDESGSKAFKALSKTVKSHFEGIIRAIETGVNNGYQEGLNAKVQFTKHLANGYHRRDRLIRMVFFRDSCRFA